MRTFRVVGVLALVGLVACKPEAPSPVAPRAQKARPAESQALVSSAYIPLLNSAWTAASGRTQPLASAGEPLLLSPSVQGGARGADEPH